MKAGRIQFISRLQQRLMKWRSQVERIGEPFSFYSHKPSLDEEKNVKRFLKAVTYTDDHVVCFTSNEAGSKQK